MTGNVFQNQPSSNARNGNMGAARLQNTKLGASSHSAGDVTLDGADGQYAAGSQAGWGGYGLGAGAALPASRPSGGFSFAQSLGGGQNQASLDLSYVLISTLSWGTSRLRERLAHPAHENSLSRRRAPICLVSTIA